MSSDSTIWLPKEAVKKALRTIFEGLDLQTNKPTREDVIEVLALTIIGARADAALAQIEACALACESAALRWPENPHVAAVLRSMAAEIRERGEQ